MTSYFMGIDPGLSGALAIIDAKKKVILLDDLPLVIVPACRKGGKVEKVIDANTLYKILKLHLPGVCMVERVHSRPGQGAVSTFAFGQSYGAALAVLDVAGVERHSVSPATWKKHYGLNSDKELSLQLALKKFPAAASLLTRKKDHGRAEALLLADYMIVTLEKRKE